MFNIQRRIARVFSCLASLLGLSLLTGSLSAAPIDFGSYTRSGGLDWLDLTETRGVSYNTISAQLTDSSSSLYGWRYATGQEFDLLMQDFGFTSSASCSTGMMYCDLYPENAPPLSSAIAMLGDTYVDYLMDEGISTSLVAGEGYSWGLLADAHGPDHQNGAMISNSLNGDPSLNYVHTYWGHININYLNHLQQGSFLVKDVSEPSSFALLAIGLFGLLRLRKSIAK
jgi:hypothetical protein